LANFVVAICSFYIYNIHAEDRLLKSRNKGVVGLVRRIAIIPTLLTLGNAVCGFASIAYASKIEPTGDAQAYFALSGWLIMAAMVFDALDGYVARLSKSASNFGMELDSLCDAISFGAAPAFLVMRMGPGWERLMGLHQTLAIVATLYMVCAILRLARFNVETTTDPSASKRFRGLPSPGAAGCLASLAILRGELAGRSPLLDAFHLEAGVVRAWIELWALGGTLAVALLMVSRVPYPHLTKQILRGRRPFRHLIQVIVAGFLLVLIRDLALVLLFWIYALGIPLRYAWGRNLQHNTNPLPATGLDERLPH
jgi:CDP-diacylglycerol--serine O-phosphatidyltransferase